jgi:hypothetical protein
VARRHIRKYRYFRRLKAFRVAHTYRSAVSHTSLEILQPAEPTKPLVIVSLRRGSRCSGLSGGSPEKKSDEAPAGVYRLRKFPEKFSPLNLGR